MNRDDQIEIIRDAFAHVDVRSITVEYDPIVEEEVARVAVRDDQLSEALRDNGADARRAAINSGIAVEVVVAD
jgi:transcription antitermination factor NusA-like protein